MPKATSFGNENASEGCGRAGELMVLAAAPQAGDVLAGKYRVERILGQGGMGTVVLATQLAIDEPVAVKLLHAALASDAELVLRFQREAKAARKIRSEHVVRILDVGTLENGAPYMVMEYLEGIDLDALLQRDGPQPVHVAVDTLLQAMEALAEAHVQGMVHRDLKPANLFLAKRASGEPLVKVLDFGISKVTGNSGAELALTKTNTKTLGSPLYMAPEQMRSLKNVDARTDIWALGVILYELLAGKPPFDGESLTELTAMILQDVPRPLHTQRRDVPNGLELAVVRCLQKDPAARHQDVAAFAAELAPYGSAAGRISAERIAGVFRQGANASPPRASTPPIRISAPPRHNITTAAPQTLGVTMPAPVPPPPPSRVVPIAIGVAVSLLVGGLAFAGIVLFALRARHREPNEPAPSAVVPAAAEPKNAEPKNEERSNDEPKNGPPAARVQMDPISGTYGVPFVVALSSLSKNATIFYTLDGSEPTTASQPYATPIRIAKHTILNAIAVAPGRSPSSSATAIYDVAAMPISAVPSVALADVPCGTAPELRTIPIGNVGAQPLSFTVAMMNGERSPFRVTSATSSIAPNATTYLVLSAQAVPRAAESIEGHADTILITDSVGRTRHISVRSRGLGQVFELPSKGPLDFEQVRAYKSSEPIAIRVRNPSVVFPVLLEATLENGSGNYLVTPPTLPLDPEQEGEFSVTFKPSGPGNHPGALRIAVRAGPACSEPVTIELRGSTNGSTK